MTNYIRYKQELFSRLYNKKVNYIKTTMCVIFLLMHSKRFDEKAMEIKIIGCVEVQDNVDLNSFSEKFIEFLESNGWYFGGSIDKYNEDKHLHSAFSFT